MISLPDYSDSAHHPKSGTPLDTNKVAESLTNCTQLIKDTFPDTGNTNIKHTHPPTQTSDTIQTHNTNTQHLHITPTHNTYT